MRIQDEYHKAFQWMREHYPTVLVDPQSIPVAELHRMVQEAVLHNNLNGADSERLVHRLLNNLIGASFLTPYFDDPSTTEIMIIGDKIYVERDGHVALEVHLPSASTAIALAEHLCEHCQEKYQTTHPLINLTWPENGARINIVHHSISPTGVAITIRKRNQERLLDLEDQLRAGMLTEEAALFLIESVRSQMNLLISGPPGSGKTTVLRGVAQAAIDLHERVVVLEDTEELRLDLEHMMVFLGKAEEVTPEEHQQGLVTLDELFRNALRQRPDRIIVGEIRGIEAFDLLQAAITAEGGVLSTIHLRRPDGLLERLLWIAETAHFTVNLDALRYTLPKAIDLIAQVVRDASGHRHVNRIVESTPDGSWRDLFAWDPSTRRLVAQNTLTDDHQRWLDAHRTSHHEANRRTPPISDVWNDILLPV